MSGSWQQIQGSSNRGTKRPRSATSRDSNQSNLYSTVNGRLGQEGEGDPDDVDVPLSKRINRLNIDYIAPIARPQVLEHLNSVSASTTSREDMLVPNSINDGENSVNSEFRHPGNEANSPNVDDIRENFSDNYPYSLTSTYYRSNELLYNLHIERTKRTSIVGRNPQTAPSPTTLDKQHLFNSNLKL